MGVRELVIEQSLGQTLLVELGPEVGHGLHLVRVRVHGAVHHSFSFCQSAVSVAYLTLPTSHFTITVCLLARFLLVSRSVQGRVLFLHGQELLSGTLGRALPEVTAFNEG